MAIVACLLFTFLSLYLASMAVVREESEYGKSLGFGYGSLVSVFFLLWSISVAVLPSIRNPRPEESLFQVVTVASGLFGEDVRLELMRGNNVRIYVSRHGYESIPFPDRAAVVDDLSGVWFSQTKSTLFAPSVYIRDIRTGEILDSRNCLWMWVKKAIATKLRKPSRTALRG